MKSFKEWIEYWKSIKLTNYWHAEVIFIVPFGIWFIWWAHKVIDLLEQLVSK